MKTKFKNFFKKIPIEISISSYKLIFIFLFPIFGVAHNRFRDKYLETSYEFFNIFLYYISYCFSLIPFLLLMILNRPKRLERKAEQEKEEQENINISNSSNDNIEIIEEEEQKRKRKELIINISILIFLCGISLTYNHFNFESYYDKKTIGLAYKIPEFFLLSFVILKYRYHIHHFITFGLNTLTYIVKYLLTIFLSNSQSYIGTHIWFYFIFSVTYCILLVFGKYYMDKYNRLPYFLMLIIGAVIGIILISIAIVKYLAISESQIFKGFYDNIIMRDSKKYVFLFLADIFSQFIYNLGLWITVYYFTPCHTIISENMMEIYYYIYDYNDNKAYWLEKDFYWNFWLMPLILVINLFCSLIFNEIIILKFCGLDFYTKVRIQERVRKESDSILAGFNKTTDNDSDSNSNRNSVSSDNNSK